MATAAAAPSFYCSTSGTTFSDKEAYLEHMRSDFHRYNLKRKVRWAMRLREGSKRLKPEGRRRGKGSALVLKGVVCACQPLGSRCAVLGGLRVYEMHRPSCTAGMWVEPTKRRGRRTIA